ncbi:Hypothetical protein D9617_8g050540 [Elsinoe fawcettii]|nr:Hypothetical protein D9617_8g050540 [Elsinoe fawcettii]
MAEFTVLDAAALVGLANLTEALTGGFLVVCTLTIALRLYVKLGMTKSVRWEDGLLLWSYACYAGLCGVAVATCIAYREHVGGDQEADERVTRLTKVFPTLYVLCSTACKTSFAIMLSHIFRGHHKTCYALAWTFCILPALMGVTYSGMSWTCGVQHDEDPEEAAECRLTATAAYISIAWSSTNALADVGYVILALYTIWLANLQIRAKIVTALLLSFGSIAAAVSLCRVVAEVKFVTIAMDETRLSICLYSILEAGVSIAALEKFDVENAIKFGRRKHNKAVREMFNKAREDRRTRTFQPQQELVQLDAEQGAMADDVDNEILGSYSTGNTGGSWKAVGMNMAI